MSGAVCADHEECQRQRGRGRGRRGRVGWSGKGRGGSEHRRERERERKRVKKREGERAGGRRQRARGGEETLGRGWLRDWRQILRTAMIGTERIIPTTPEHRRTAGRAE
eukprot:916975-Rhodomonas_salina.2